MTSPYREAPPPSPRPRAWGELRELRVRQRIVRTELDRLISGCDHRHRGGKDICPDCGQPYWYAAGFDPYLDKND